MRVMADFIQSLPLPAMFLATLVASLLGAILIMISIRMILRFFGYGPGLAFPVRDAVVTATSAMFALMIAFSAAGIWNESIQARAAVQREANALENLRSIADSFPADLRERTKSDVRAYARQVLDGDWPAMAHKVDFLAPIYDQSENILIALLEAIAGELGIKPTLPGAAPAIGQIVEARSARLQRIMLATQGVSAAQWLAMVLIAATAIVAVAIVHNHEPLSQWFAIAIYAAATAAAFFVILAHDRPFIGRISVSPEPIAHLLPHELRPSR